MAIVTRFAPHILKAALLPTLIAFAAPAAAQPASRTPTSYVAPVQRVDLGAPDPRCSDLAYPLWDDGMCVRAKCADDDACDFSKVASAQTPAPPTGLAQERWRMATLRPAPSADQRPAPIQLARLGHGRAKVAVPLLAEARILDGRTAAARARPPNHAPPARAMANATANERTEPRPSLWNRIRAALRRLWVRILIWSRLTAPGGQAPLLKGAP